MARVCCRAGDRYRTSGFKPGSGHKPIARGRTTALKRELKPGGHKITLKVRDDSGRSATDTVMIYVKPDLRTMGRVKPRFRTDDISVFKRYRLIRSRNTGGSSSISNWTVQHIPVIEKIIEEVST